MAEFLTSSDGATMDDRVRRFVLDEFEGWAYNDNTQILGPFRKARSRGAYRTPNKIVGSIDFNNPKIDENSEYLNAVRRAGTTLLGLIYNEAGSQRDFICGEMNFEDVPETYGDVLTTSLTAMIMTPPIEPLEFDTDADSFIPNVEITSGTPISLGTIAATDGVPVILLDVSKADTLGASPSIDVELAITGATGTPWSVTIDNPRVGLYVVDFNAAPQAISLHPNVNHASAADAAQVAAATTAGATSVEITLTNFSGTRTDTIIDAYIGRQVQRN